MSSFSLIKTKIENNIGSILFDNYGKRNVLSEAMVDELLTALDHMQAEHVRVVILSTAEFNKVWSAGHDVSELPKANSDPLPYNDPLEKILRAVRKFPAPVIAMVHGSVWGGACELTMNCDIIIGDESCAFAMTPAKIGLPYNVSGIQHFLNRIPINVVKEMFFTAEPLAAERALRHNLVNEIVPEEKLIEHTYKIAATICQRSHESVAVFKEQARLIEESCSINPEVFEYINKLRADVYNGKDYNEGIRAFLEKRVPVFSNQHV